MVVFLNQTFIMLTSFACGLLRNLCGVSLPSERLHRGARPNGFSRGGFYGNNKINASNIFLLSPAMGLHRFLFNHSQNHF